MSLAVLLLWSAPSLAQTYDVTNAADSGAGSLRQAVTDLNASGAAGDIRFVSGSSGTIDLTTGGLTLTQQGSLLNNSGGDVTISLSGASNVTALTATSLGTLGGASGLAIEATGTGSNVSAISSASTLIIDAVGATASLTATAVEDNVYGIRAIGDMTIGQFAGSVTASSTVWQGVGAYGLVSDTGSVTIGAIAETGRIRAEIASRESYAVSGATGVTIVGELAGDIEAVSGVGFSIGSDAYGIYSSGGAVSIGAIAETGSITAWGEWSSSYGIWASGDVAIGSMAGAISATSEMGPSVYGILSANGSITIASIAETGSISSLAGASFTGAIFAATGDVEITGAMAGRLSATSTADGGGGTHVFGITAYNGALSIGSIAATGFVSTLAARDKAYALYGDDGVTIGGDMAGILLAEATTGGEAYGVLSEGGSVSIGAITQTGQIAAIAGTNEAYGIRAFDNVTITGQMAGGILATAAGGDDAYGILADSGDVVIGDMGGAADSWASVIALAGGDTAVGIGAELGSVTIASLARNSQIMAVAGGMTAFGIQAGDTLTITHDLAGMVIASAGTMTVGLGAGTVNIGSVSQTGWILSHSAGDEAYGILAACDVSIAGGMAGIISAMADGNTAVGIMAFQELNGGDATTALAVSGTVVAQADGLAVGVASGEAMNLHVTGTVAGVDIDTTDGDDGYAIRAGVADGFGGWIAGSADNTVTLGTGATLVGKVDLGTGGNNTLNLLGTGALDNLFVGVDHLTVGDGLTASVWNLSFSSGNASVFGDLDINALTTLRLNENVTLTGDTVNDGTFIYNVGADTAYGGAISGAGTLVKDGAATLTLSGDHTYSGATIVASGLLDVTGALASQAYQIYAGAGLTMASAFTLTGDAVVNGTWTTPLLTIAGTGTLAGSGVIAGDVTSYGLIAPGNSPGTLTIGGDLLLGAGSLLDMEITPMGHDLVHVTGTTTIADSAMHVDIASGFYANGQRFTLLFSDGGITGSAPTLTINNQSPFLRFSIVDAGIGGTSVVVGVDRQSYAIAATSRNSYGAGLGLTGATLVATPAMQTVLGQIDFMSQAEVAQGLKQMSPEPYSALMETSFSAMRLFSDTIRERAYATRGGGESVLAMVPGGEMSRMTELASRQIASDAPSGITAASGKAGGLGLFVKPVGQYVGFDKGHNRTGFQSWQYGLVAGGDMAVSDNLLAGFQVGYVHSELSFSDTAKSSGRSDTFLGGLYAAYATGGFYADGLVQAGAAWNRLSRKMEFGSISRNPQGTYTSFLFGGSLTTGYDWTFGKFKAGPVATLDYGYVDTPGFTESDSELGLTVRGFLGNSLKSGLGAKVSGTFTVGEKTTVSPDVSLRWGHEFLDNSQNIKARYNGSPTSSFSAKTGEPTRDNLLVDAGVSVGVSDATKLYLRYSGQILGQGSQTQAGAVGVRYEF